MLQNIFIVKSFFVIILAAMVPGLISKKGSNGKHLTDLFSRRAGGDGRRPSQLGIAIHCRKSVNWGPNPAMIAVEKPELNSQSTFSQKSGEGGVREGSVAQICHKLCAKFAQNCRSCIRGRARKFVGNLKVNFGQFSANTPFPLPPSPNLGQCQFETPP